ncbi:MAG TPA: tryptophan synthase subunit alpha [Pyrinomonadaceae bacterium]|nr:tryptophan synthase subunit alpha [Pyrinomonadaceae bacterium]
MTKTFETLKRGGKKGFIPFITAGDPDLDTTRELIVELARVGATVIELGIPFTDPMADGPVIQRASERALRHDFGVGEVLQIVSDARKETDVPIILFSYFNPLLQFCANEDRGRTSPPSKQVDSRLEAGLVPPGVKFEKLAADARASGVDGILVTDLVPEEANEFVSILRANDLDMIFLIAPTSTDERLKMVAECASGFIYAVSRAGITGARDEMSAEAEKLVRRMRKFSDLPIAVGFGISTPEHVKDVWRYADAAVVGSAIVAEIERAGRSSEVVPRVGEFVRQLLA